MESKKIIPANGKFPVLAASLNLQKYTATDTLGKAEKEEAAVRLLMYSKEEGSYVGIPWSTVVGKIVEEQKGIPRDVFSIILMTSGNPYQCLINTFWELIDEGLVIKESVDGLDFFIPTPELVAKITSTALILA